MTLLQISEPEEETILSNRRIAIGIDLGTTNSLVSFINELGEPEIICDDNGNSLFPSIVSYRNDNSVLMAYDAIEFLGDLNTISSFKRFIGKTFKDINVDDIPYEFVNNDNFLKIKTVAGDITPVEISAHMILFLKRLAEKKLKKEINDVVITVPAYFNESQRQSTCDAANLAGLNILRLLNEPTSAAIAYGLENTAEGVHIVFDLGGGTFDVSILKINAGLFEVIATSGDTSLGGNDFDRVIVDYICNSFIDEIISLEDRLKLFHRAKEIREYLSDNDSYIFSIELDNGRIVEGFITRDIFENLSNKLLERIKTCLNKAMLDSRLEIRDIFDIVMVGGATRMPVIRKLVNNFFAKEPLCSIDPDKVVAIGASFQADRLVNNLDNDWLLLDVTPLSLGIETMGGFFEKIIFRNTKIPTIAKQEFTTIKDFQKAISIHVLQGESNLASECRSLSYFELNDIPLMKAGIPRIEVLFQIDADGLLKVFAKDINTNIEASVIVKPSNGLTSDIIKNMIYQYNCNQNVENSKRKLSEAKLYLQKLIETVKDAIDKDKDLLSTQELEKINILLLKANKNIDSSDISLIKKITNELSKSTEDFAILRMNNAIKKLFYN
ncbi:molecular chaperone HscA [Candidatus Kinetoplastibacterium desouzaii TCC079E]|uniref:Molecular chaperone HscA n=1 Tax=Candidatus Kinetoplastidibacterium desouzai TCC079E TaxID=1208919 RepID=M1LU44_9PROT|nr:Fe-S protein assembly chaperone HscA [Candidatus Kinetoplastibacterium desouzaii]AGF46809.1 molecular chaperone HscA [Candidatus Kinetoplastibacterium desouzaii TCC079E]